MPRKYKIDRDKVRDLHKKGYGYQKIADTIGCCRHTVRKILGSQANGRPLKPLSEEKVAELAYNGCKNSEIGYILGVDEETIANRFSGALAKSRAIKRADLRAVQIKKALAGDVTMLIWLGKNELEQTDKLQNDHAGTVEIKVTYEELPIDNGAYVRYMEHINGTQKESTNGKAHVTNGNGHGNGHDPSAISYWKN